LLSQLLDGHSRLHVHPGELHIGRPRKYDWPQLDLQGSADELFDRLFERPLLEYVAQGYQKVSHAEASVDPDYRQRVLPFLFDIGLQRRIFTEQACGRPIARQRDALDLYVTSYFNAWLDYQGLYRDPDAVKYWVCFGARVLSQPGNFDRFLEDYPDGKAITVIRDPVSWYASARRHSTEYEDPAAAAMLWRGSFEGILRNVREQPERTLVVSLEDTISQPRTVMTRVAAFLGIEFEPCLLVPTFNGIAIQSDSSFGSKYGLDATAIDRRDRVPREVRTALMDVTGPVYEELLRLARETLARPAQP
jgi:hypothetical protein